MSSLLDVLHKRPPRSQADDEPVPAAGPSAASGGSGAGLALAADLALATGSHRAPLSPASPANADGISADSGIAVAPEVAPELPPASPREPAGNGTSRRWTDPAAAPAPVALLPAQARAVALASTSRERKLLIGGLLAAASVVAALLVYMFNGQSAETMLVMPVAEMAPAATAAPVEPAAVEPEVPVVRSSRRALAVIAEPVEAEESASAEWLDEPALPAESVAESSSPAPVIEITRGTTTDPQFEKLRTAWDALQAGDNVRAETIYREVLATNAGQLDALLGLGALATRGGRMDEARELYRQVHRLDPKNSHAAAALAMLPGTVATRASESQLKTLLREQPDSAALHFALGLHYVANQRWSDAQTAFFEAVRHQPMNADYAFNLAIALDRLGQVQPAISYYQRALDLTSGTQQFDVEAARARLLTLRGA